MPFLNFPFALWGPPAPLLASYGSLPPWALAAPSGKQVQPHRLFFPTTGWAQEAGPAHDTARWHRNYDSCVPLPCSSATQPQAGDQAAPGPLVPHLYG